MQGESIMKEIFQCSFPIDLSVRRLSVAPLNYIWNLPRLDQSWSSILLESQGSLLGRTLIWIRHNRHHCYLITLPQNILYHLIVLAAHFPLYNSPTINQNEVLLLHVSLRHRCHCPESHNRPPRREPENQFRQGSNYPSSASCKFKSPGCIVLPA